MIRSCLLVMLSVFEISCSSIREDEEEKGPYTCYRSSVTKELWCLEDLEE